MRSLRRGWGAVTGGGHVACMTESNAEDMGREWRSVPRVMERIQTAKRKPASETSEVPIPGDEIFLDPFGLGGASSR